MASTPVTSIVKFSQSLWTTRSEPSLSTEFIEKVTQAAKLGFLYLEMPSDLKPLINNDGVEFSNGFYKNQEIRSIPKQSNYTGFIVRNNAQCESLYLGRSHWDCHLSKNVADMTKKMNQVNIDILKVFLRHFSIVESDYDQASAGAVLDQGASVCAFHHYRSENKQQGLDPHKDFAFITLLFINKLGLQFKVDEEWVDAVPVEGYFVVNIGRTLENLINDRSKLIAPIHRVIQCVEERVSFVAQLEGNLERPLYRLENGGLVKSHESCKKYIDEILTTKNFL